MDFDVGINNLDALFINDKITESLLLYGKKYKSYNVYFNRFKAKLDEIVAAHGDLLNRIDEKCKMMGIKLHDVDEAYTSKSSCIK